MGTTPGGRRLRRRDSLFGHGRHAARGSALRSRRAREPARLRAAARSGDPGANLSAGPRIALAPGTEAGIERAIADAGGSVVAVDRADGLVWTDPLDPRGLADVLSVHDIGWVQLPFAGIEEFVDAGVVDGGRVWTCAKGVYGPAVAEHALALTLTAARRLHVHVRARTWRDARSDVPERRLAGATIAVVGTGGIGRSYADLVGRMGAVVVAINRSGRPLAGADRTVTSDALTDVAARADFLVLATSLTPATRGLVGAGLLAVMKPEAWVINVARGALVDTAALVEALGSRAIGGAALDVTDPEPLPPGHPLWDLDNAVVTPHSANTWDMALPELRALVGRNVAKLAAGEHLEGVVDPELGY